MSEKNLQIVAQVYQALNEKNISYLLNVADAAIEISQTAELPWGGKFQGISGLKKFLTALAANIESTVTISDSFEAGEQIVAIGRSIGQIRTSGKQFDVRVVHLWTLRNGKVVRFEPLIDTSAMLRILPPKQLGVPKPASA